MSELKAIRGTKDILPDEVGYWQEIEKVARNTLTAAAYSEIRTPIFELTSLYERGIGETTDVVGKEMYTFLSRGEEPYSITLRPEGTAGVVRSYIEHHLDTKGITQRLFYIGPMFRYENPQAGRQRQFHQLGVELLGSDNSRSDAEVIAIATDILITLGLTNLTIEINSIGDSSDRQKYRQVLIDYLTPYQADLDPDSQARLTRNPLRILDSKNKKTREIIQDAPQILDILSVKSKTHFDKIQNHLKLLNINYTINPRLVRGLDYYNHIAFEITSDQLGAQSTVCGGGRYDGLVNQLGGPVTPAVGWAMGIERLIILLQKIKNPPKPQLDFYLVSKGAEAENQSLLLAQQLRKIGFSVELDLSASAFSKQLKRADKSGAIACLIIGDSEATNNTIGIKWLITGEQETISQSDLINNPHDFREKIKLIST